MRGFFVTLSALSTLSAAAFSTSSAADDPTSHQAAMTKLAAKMVYGESRCRDRYDFNVAMLDLLGSAYKVSMADWRPGGRFRNLLEADIEVLKAEHGSSSDEMFCRALYANYGMNGLSAPGLMKRR